MKKLIITVLMLSLLLASCSDKNGNETGSDTTPDTNETTTETDSTLGDNDGDGNVKESDTDNTESDSDNADSGETTYTAVTKVENANDAINFIGANVYSLCPDEIPMFTDSISLPLTDTDNIKFNTGLDDLSGVTDIIISESGVGSFPYSYIMVRTDGSNTDDIQKKLGSGVDPNKWICVSAEKVASVTLDNDVVLIMGYADQVDAIMDATLKAAEGVYENIGSVVNVLG